MVKLNDEMGLQVEQFIIPLVPCYICNLTSPKLTVVFERPTDNRLNREVTYYVYDVQSAGELKIEFIAENATAFMDSEVLDRQILTIVYSKASSTVPGELALLNLLSTLIVLYPLH